MSVKVRVTCLRTGNQSEFKNAKLAATKGGFVYGVVLACIKGQQASHCGHTFKALTPLSVCAKKEGRYHEVGALLTRGMDYQEIADHLGIKKTSVRYYAARARAMDLAPAVDKMGRTL